MSYFVGADAMSNDKFKGEDAGFAINGGKGWSKVVFSNHQVDLNGPVAIAMGSYDFTDASSGDVVTVEYTFGYKRCAGGTPSGEIFGEARHESAETRVPGARKSARNESV